jgi:hypothetical protein|nr:MAG TPA: hypothetical protein [Caudoviricetes sp.]
MHHYHLLYKHNPSDKWNIYTTTASDNGTAITNLLKDKEAVYDYRIIKQESIEDNDTNIGHNLFKLIAWIITMALVLWVVQQK